MPVLIDGRYIDVPYEEGEIAGPTLKEKYGKKIRDLHGLCHKVLFLGEEGTGKTYLAKLVYQKSKKNKKRFVSIDMATLPEDFGEFYPAFIGIDKNSGLRNARDGAVLLENVTSSQTKYSVILELLDQGSLYGYGIGKAGAERIEIPATIMGTTRESDPFRVNDGYHSLKYNFMQVIETTPLRGVRSDIPYLLSFFINSSDSIADKSSFIIPAPLTRFLCEMDWPGNIAQLKSQVEMMSEHLREDQPELEYAATYNLLKNYLTEKNGFSSLLKVIGYNYVSAVADSQSREHGNKRPLTSILELTKKNIDYIRNLNLPNITETKILLDYTYQSKSFSDVLTRYAKAFLGMKLEQLTEYPDSYIGIKNGDQVVVSRPDINKFYGSLHTHIYRGSITRILNNTKKIQFEDVFPDMHSNKLII